MKSKVYLIGKTPPPLGGVTIHVQRLKQLLEKSEEYVIEHLEIKKFWKVLFINKKYPEEFIHLHTSRTLLRLLVLIISKLTKRKLIITIHSYRNKSNIQVYIDKYISSLANKVIAVGGDLFELLENNYEFKNLLLVDPFIPPTEEELVGNVSKENLFGTNAKVLCINAYTILKENNKDIYGIMTILKLFNKIKLDNSIVMYIVVGSITDNLFYKEILNYIQDKDIGDVVKIIIGEPLIPYIKVTDIFIRPTLEDSYGISIAEALYLGKVAIASDVCPRPKGCYIYKSITDLEKVLLHKLNLNRNIQNNVIFDYERYLKIYE